MSRHSVPALVIAKALVDPSSCISHPSYQAVRRPRTLCQECHLIWHAVQLKGGIKAYWRSQVVISAR